MPLDRCCSCRLASPVEPAARSCTRAAWHARALSSTSPATRAAVHGVAAAATVAGALECEDVVGGDRNNYDGELAHRLDVLHALSRRKDVRLLYLYDSTSPIIAGEHFRRSTTSARARFECDDWQGSAMAFEQLLDSVTYWWYKSHCGHLPEAAADDLAKNYLQDDPTPLPHAPSRHVALRLYAKRSELDLMLATANLSLVRRRSRWAMRFAPRWISVMPCVRLSCVSEIRCSFCCCVMIVPSCK